LLSCSYHIPHQLQTQIRQKQIRSSFLSWAKECNCNTLLHFFPSLSKQKASHIDSGKSLSKPNQCSGGLLLQTSYHHSSVLH
jgi:hypothetical protein